MSKTSPVSDTALLQSMLQRLKLIQTYPNTQEEASSPTKLNSEPAESSSKTSVFQFGDSMDNQQCRSPSIWTTLDRPGSVHSFNRPTKGLSATPSWGYVSSCAPSDIIIFSDDDKIPRWQKHLKLSKRKVSEVSYRASTINMSIPATPSPTSPILRTTEEHSGVWTERVGVENIKRDNLNAAEHQTQTSRINMRKPSHLGKKKWTQKVKERWKERHKERDGKLRQEMNEEATSSKTKSTPHKTEHTTAAFFKEEKNISHQPINSKPDVAPPNPFDSMGESIFSFGSLNLMEEICSGEEWAKFFSSSTSSQHEPISMTAETTPHSTCQLPHRELTIDNQLDNKVAPEQMNSESFQQEMDISDNTFNQTKKSDLFQTFEFLKDQSELFDFSSNQLQSMDLSISQSENNDQPHHQAQLLDMHQNHQSWLPTGARGHQSNEHNLSHAQLSDQNHEQPEILHLLDLSYLQPKDSSSLNGSSSRKRGHYTLRRGSSDQGRSDMGQMQWRDNAMTLPYSSPPVPSLSPASSISSLQHSISQDSESSASTETVVKRRRLEESRRVRFAEEVLFIPPPILSDDEGEAGDDDSEEDLQSRPSTPNWIAALRTKTKRRPRLKFPQIAGTPTKFKSSNLLSS